MSKMKFLCEVQELANSLVQCVEQFISYLFCNSGADYDFYPE
jgi:hypothetical protein